MVAGGDVAGCQGVADDFGVALDGHCGVLVGAIDNGHHGLALKLASHHIDAVVGQELSLLTLGNHIIACALAPMEQST